MQMYNRVEAASLQDLMRPIGQRAGRGVFFARLCGWNDQIKQGVWAYHEAATRKGVIIEDQIPNPDERQLQFLNETIGGDFRPEAGFIVEKLKKWMPRMSDQNRAAFSQTLCNQFDELRRRGKTESVLRNVYFKLMCWLYYKFERLMPFLGDDEPPRILYQTKGITAHELTLIRILNRMGADVLLLEPAGDAAYLKQDPQSEYSQMLALTDKPFPPDFSLKQLRKSMMARPVSPKPQPSPNPAPPVKPVKRQIDPASYFPKPAKAPCTNAWMETAAYAEILTPILKRGDDFNLFYNAFIRVTGVQDKSTYISELHQFYQKFKSTGRCAVIVDSGLQMPDPEEVERIRRRSYRQVGEMIVDLAGNLPACHSAELQREMQKAFVEAILEASKAENSLSRLLISAVYVLCWIQRYQSRLFQGYKSGDTPCFILMGGCQNVHDALYMRYLSLLPVDVLIFAPDLNRPCALKAENLLELTYDESMKTPPFPRDAATLQLSTAAANAQDDLTTMLYTDSGLYRNRQFAKAEALTLRTTYDEIFILWNQELRYRSAFQTVEQTVTMPVVYAKVSGVEGDNLEAYWQKIKLLCGKDTFFAKRMPILPSNAPNPYQSLAMKALRDGLIRRKLLRDHRQYPFSILREELQEHILDKLQLMLDRRLIRGTFENGTEYTVVATILNLDKSILRMLQSFDFTRKSPKCVVISTDDRDVSVEDAILLTFLNLVGFDIAMFVPTGYQTIERHLNGNLPVEHQIGDYHYDLTVPDFDALPPLRERSWWENLFKRR